MSSKNCTEGMDEPHNLAQKCLGDYENHHLKIYPKFGVTFEKKTGTTTNQMTPRIVRTKVLGLMPMEKCGIPMATGCLAGRSRFSRAFPAVNKSGR